FHLPRPPPTPPPFPYTTLFRSRALEAPQRVAFLGPAGTYSEQAALQFFGSSIVRVPCVSIDEVFQAATSGSADFGVVPVENNTRSEEHTSELQSQSNLVCRLLL